MNERSGAGAGAQRAPADAHPLRVLVVEDEALNRALIRAIIQRAGEPPVDLFEADTIAVAHDVLERESIDVVLLDVRLPDGNGLDLAEQLRRRENVPMIAILSASVLAEEREAAESSGADAFLGKPFIPRELLALLEGFRDRVAARNESRT